VTGEPAAQLDWASAAGLGALQGIAEFLPISSSGHLSLAQAWLGIDPESAGHSFNIVLHAGTLLAVLVIYRLDLRMMCLGLFRPNGDRERARLARRTLAAIVVGTIPLGLVLIPQLEGIVITMEGEPRWVGVALLATAAMLAFSHRRRAPIDDANTPPSPRRALLIGLAQLVAVLPGISRSGSTIAAALGLGLGRARAARFSFLLSIPAILGATLKEGLDLVSAETPSVAEPSTFAIGFVVSFLTGLLALRGLLKLIERFGMIPFVPYLVIVGIVAIALG
jgi:undecaprenyl-diphosphatase